MEPNRKGEIPPTRRSPEGGNHNSPDNSPAAGRQTPGGGGRSRRSHTTYRMAVSAIFCALGVVVLGLGALVEVIDMTAAALAALLFLPILYRYGNGYALLCWGVTAILGVMLMPQNLASWLYLCLLGYYPVLKQRLDRLPRLLAVLSKLALVLVALGFYLLLFWLIMMNGEGTLAEIFVTGFGEGEGSTWMAWILVGLCIMTFFIFDLLIDKLSVLYRLRWRKRVEKWLK